jgi:hypothetical protein
MVYDSVIEPELYFGGTEARAEMRRSFGSDSSGSELNVQHRSIYKKKCHTLYKFRTFPIIIYNNFNHVKSEANINLILMLTFVSLKG